MEPKKIKRQSSRVLLETHAKRRKGFSTSSTNRMQIKLVVLSLLLTTPSKMSKNAKMLAASTRGIRGQTLDSDFAIRPLDVSGFGRVTFLIFGKGLCSSRFNLAENRSLTMCHPDSIILWVACRKIARLTGAGVGCKSCNEPGFTTFRLELRLPSCLVPRKPHFRPPAQREASQSAGSSSVDEKTVGHLQTFQSQIIVQNCRKVSPHRHSAEARKTVLNSRDTELETTRISVHATVPHFLTRSRRQRLPHSVLTSSYGLRGCRSDPASRKS